MIHVGDCRDILPTLPAESVDSIVTDPPYGIGFMGKAWDGRDIQARHERRTGFASQDPSAWSERGGHKSAAAAAGAYDLSPRAMRAFQDWTRDWATEALRVLKPGGWLLSFASPRTYHRMTCGLEEAGFEIRNQVMWVFGQGFPKSLNPCKCGLGVQTDSGIRDPHGWRLCGACGKQFEVGTDLKPAHEPIALARKPFVGTVEANLATNGTGVLNIEGCRVPTTDDLNGGAYSAAREGRAVSQSLSPSGMNRQGARASGEYRQPGGRWPANLIHDGSDEVLAAFPTAPGQMADESRSAPSSKTSNVYGAMQRQGEPSQDDPNTGGVGFKMRPGARRLDSGSAARFFYCAKAARSDRNDGLDDPGPQFKKGSTLRDAEKLNAADERKGNHHPTVKPTELMRYLCRLVTPPGGLVLDPFTGSGSTGRGAIAEGMQFIGIELDQEYAEIACRRIAAVQPGLALAVGGDR